MKKPYEMLDIELIRFPKQDIIMESPTGTHPDDQNIAGGNEGGFVAP